MKLSELKTAEQIHREALRDWRVRLWWLLSQPRHQAELAWLRWKARR